MNASKQKNWPADMLLRLSDEQWKRDDLNRLGHTESLAQMSPQLFDEYRWEW